MILAVVECSGWCGAVLWIYAEHRADNVEMLLLLLSRGCIEPRPFLLLVLLGWGGDWRYMGSWEGQVTGHSQDR